MLKTNKKHAVLFFFIKLLLFAAVIYVIYDQLAGIEENKWKNFSLKHPFSLALAVVLVVPNMWMVFMPWKATLEIMHLADDKRRNVHSFFAGLVTGMLTPNMAGNFIGRFYYFEKKHRGTITFLTLVSNYAQFLATLVFGAIAVLYVGEIYQISDDWRILSLIMIGVAVALITYFYLERPLKWFKRSKFLAITESLLREHPIYRWKLLAWSLGRFLIFTFQSALVLQAFGEEMSLQMILAIWQVYFITMMVPSLFLGKLGVKEVISIGVLGALGMNEFSIIFSSLFIWFLNSLAPAVLGLIICKRPEEWE